MGGDSPGRRFAFVGSVFALLTAALLTWANWTNVTFLLLFEGIGENPQGYSEYRHRNSGIVFVSLPEGEFDMGSPEDEPGSERDERPRHSVRVSSFLIAKYESGGYERCMA